MGVLLFLAFLVINAYNIAAENPVTPKPYRFTVYPVNKCPSSKNEFQTAAKQKNCTRGLRYLCSPNKYLSSLIEFCTDRPRSLYGKGNCVLLEGTGDLDHYRCAEKFNSSCPSEPYYDEEIYNYPACLEIDKELRCFVADKDCNERQFSTTEIHLNISKMDNVKNETFSGASNGWIAIIYIIIALLLAGTLLSWIIFHQRKKEKKTDLKDPYETMSLLINAPDDNTSTEIIPIDETQSKKLKKREGTKNDEQTDDTIKKEPTQDDESERKEIKQTETQEDDPLIDERILKQFLGKGLLTVRHVRCIIVGCGKAGKTTLLKRLQNVTFEELIKTDRTELVDVHVNSFEVLEEQNTIQSVKEKEKLPAVVFTADSFKGVTMQKNAKKESKYDEKEGGNSGIKEIDRLPAVVLTADNSNKVEIQISAREERRYDSEKKDNSGDRKKNEKLKMQPSRGKNKDGIPMNTNTTAKAMETVENEVSDSKKENVPKPASPIITTNSKHVSSHMMPDRNEENVDSCSADDNNEDYAISKIMDVVRLLKNEKNLRPRITFLDFAGQNMYYAYHQIFLSPKSCSILVMDMTKTLNEKVDFSHKDEQCCGLFESWTYRDYYTFWLKSIDSFCDKQTPVVVVGTHADQLSENECGKFMEDFFSSVDSENLQRHLNRDREFIIGFPETGNQPEDLKDLKKCLAEIVQGCDFLEQKIRPVCAVFEHILIREKEEKKIISRQTLLNYKDKLSTEEFKIDDDEISRMLLFLNSVGTILYFKEDYLKDKIILDIQWFLDAFKCILNYPSDMIGSDSKRRRFYETGELDDEELNRIWKTCLNKGNEYLDHKSTLLAYMEQFGLLTESTSHIPQSESVNSTWYYVPSMNKRKFDKTGEEFSKSSILCFKFDDKGQLPIHVFYGLVVKCFKIPEWSILTENGKNCIYENAACFSFKEHILVLCICNFEIRMQVWWFPGKKDAKLLEGIQYSVLNILKMYTKYSYKVGYKCQNGMINATENKSFIDQSKFPLSDFLCKECDVDKKHPVFNDISWIQQTNTLDNQGNTTLRKSNREAITNLAISEAEITVCDAPSILKKELKLIVQEPISRKFSEGYFIDLRQSSLQEKLNIIEWPPTVETKSGYILHFTCFSGESLSQLSLRKCFGDPNDQKNTTKYSRPVHHAVQFISELHESGWILRDICCQHLHFDSNNQKVFSTRLGRMAYISSEEDLDDIIIDEVFQDHKNWFPLEILRHGEYTKEGDVYMLAMAIYEFYMGLEINLENPTSSFMECVPFCRVPKQELIDRLLSGEVPHQPMFCPGELYDMMERCWNRDRTRRPTCAEILQVTTRLVLDSELSPPDYAFSSELSSSFSSDSYSSFANSDSD